MFNNKNIKKIAVILVWILIIALVLSTFSFMVFAQTQTVPRQEEGSLSEELLTMQDLIQFIQDNYVEEVSAEDLLQGAYQGIFDRLDPYSVYYVTTEDGTSFTQTASGIFYGLGVDLAKDAQGVKITDFYGDSSGESAGLKIGDYFLTIDGQDVRNSSAAEVAELLRGDLGTTVYIEVQRGEEIVSVQAIRAKVLLHSVAAGLVGEDIGYLSISNFYEATDSDVKAQWNALKEESPQIRGLIIDVRDNPGGLVSSAVRTADLFLEKGSDILHYEKRGEIIATYQAEEEKTIDVPTVVLINGNSASASEIFAAALQDNGAAELVGTTTYGKGAAQVVYSLANGAAMKLTVFHFLTPLGNTIHQIGVKPDYTIYNRSQEEVQEKLNSVGTLAPMSEEKKYQKGESGLNVFGAQQRLIILGETNVTPTAVMDQETFDAVKRFQKQAGLYVYGVLDYATMKALEEAIAREIFGTDQDDQFNKAVSLLQ